jgi:hypothetical protein
MSGRCRPTPRAPRLLLPALLLLASGPVVADYEPLQTPRGGAAAVEERPAGALGGPLSLGADSVSAEVDALGFERGDVLVDSLGVPADQRDLLPLDFLFGASAAEAAGAYGDTAGVVLGISAYGGVSGSN